MTALKHDNIIRLIRGLIPANLDIDIRVKPTSNGASEVDLINRMLDYGIDFCIYDSIGENTITRVDDYTERVRSMLYLQQFLDTLMTPNTSVTYEHDPYRNRVDFTRSGDPRHYALIETDDHITLVWVASIKTINKKPIDCDIVLKQWPNPVISASLDKTLKQVLDDAQTKTFDQLTNIS